MMDSLTSKNQRSFETILTEKKGKNDCVGLIRFNRPNNLNSFTPTLLTELAEALHTFQKDNGVSAIVITGNPTVFAAGMDLNEMRTREYHEVADGEWIKSYLEIANIRKPIIAAVNGVALGAGCELAMACDIAYAGDQAQFAQPEVIVGTIPGGGGSQRLTRAAGKSVAMEMILTGGRISAQEAKEAGIVSKVFPADTVVDEAVKLGEKIAQHSQLVVALAKEAVNAAFESTLREGLHFERTLFHATFSLNDRKEGMTAFLIKRQPKYTNT